MKNLRKEKLLKEIENSKISMEAKSQVRDDIKTLSAEEFEKRYNKYVPPKG